MPASLLLGVAVLASAVAGVAVLWVLTEDNMTTGYVLLKVDERRGDSLYLLNEKGGTSIYELADAPVFDCRTDCELDVRASLGPVSEGERACTEVESSKFVQLWIGRSDCFGAEEW